MSIYSFPRYVYYGPDSLDMLPDIIKNYNITKILIVTDKTIAKLGFLDKIMNKIRVANVESLVFDNVEEEPTFKTAEIIGEMAIKFNPNAIIALGGGSVIDAAKGGWVKYERPDFDIKGISPFEWLGISRKSIFIAIPTTSGTGSESTLGIVLSEVYEGQKKKIALGSYEIVPNIVFLCVDFPAKMPKKLTLVTALDALTHSIEAYVSNTATIFTDALAEKAAISIFKHLPTVLENPEDLNARENIHLAAWMAGVAFSNSGTGIAHAIGHALGPKVNLPHGLAVGMVLPFVVRYNYQDENVNKKYSWLANIISESTGIKLDRLHNMLVDFYRKIDVPKLSGVIDKDKFERIIDSVVEEAMEDPDMVFNPVSAYDEDIKRILWWAYREELL